MAPIATIDLIIERREISTLCFRIWPRNPPSVYA
jgi:hypothetical protein